MTVRELLERTDSRELSEWMAYDQLDRPIGDDRLVSAVAQLAAMYRNRYRPENAEAMGPADFIPFREPPEKSQQTAEQMQEALRLVTGT